MALGRVVPRRRAIAAAAADRSWGGSMERYMPRYRFHPKYMTE